MPGLRAASVLAVMLAAASAAAQPLDPYAPSPSPTPSPSPSPSPTPSPTPTTPVDPYAAPAAPQDPVLAEQIAESLVGRAQELLDAKVYADAKQLAVEALVKAPTGPAADRAKLVIKQANAALGIVEPVDLPPPDLRPIQEPVRAPETPTPPQAEGARYPREVAAVHGALFGATLGAAIGSFFSDSNEAAGAVPMALGLGAAGAIFGPMLASHYHADEAQVREVGSGVVWGGVIGGLFAGTVQGGDGGNTTGRGVLVGAALGASLGGLGGIGFAVNHKLTRGDVALTDTFAGIGAVGGLTVGMLMQPAQREAYSLNAALGAAAGVVVGVIAAPQTNTTPRRMLRVAGMAAAGGAAPFLLYAAIYSNSTSADERVTGALSTLGLVGGAWLGFYLTRHLDEGLDVPDGKPDPDDAPPAVVGRNSDGRWSLGGLALAPLSPRLTTDRGTALTLVGGAF